MRWNFLLRAFMYILTTKVVFRRKAPKLRAGLEEPRSSWMGHTAPSGPCREVGLKKCLPKPRCSTEERKLCAQILLPCEQPPTPLLFMW